MAELVVIDTVQSAFPLFSDKFVRVQKRFSNETL